MNTDKRSRDLTRAFPDDPDRLSLLHGRLAATARQDRILDIACRYGHITSYAAVARLADRPKAVRVVGTACATNPLPVVLPCHRVVHSHGSLGGYLDGAGLATG